MSNTNSSSSEAKSDATPETAPAPEKRKTPLEMKRELQANMQAARRGVGKKGAKGSTSSGGAHGTDNVSKPVQITRKTGG